MDGHLIMVHCIISFSKSIFKVVSTSFVCPGKPISDSYPPPSKAVSASSVRAGVNP